MAIYGKYISSLLYVLSLFLIIGVGIDTIWISRKFVLAGEGIGVYGVLIYYAAAFVSVLFWGISYWLIPSTKLALVFWVIFLALTIFIALQPTWWAAPSLESH